MRNKDKLLLADDGAGVILGGREDIHIAADGLRLAGLGSSTYPLDPCAIPILIIGLLAILNACLRPGAKLPISQLFGIEPD